MCTGHSEPASSEEMASLLNRRGFLTAAAATTAAAVGASTVLAAPAAAHGGGGGHGRHRVPRDHISIQLYTLRNILAIDFEGTVAELADIGYRRVEHAGFVGRSVEEFKAVMDANGIWVSSGHVGIPQPFDAAAWQASLENSLFLGSKYIVHPFFSPAEPSVEAWTAFAHDLNRAGRQARRVGLRFGYHNHHFEFLRLPDDPSRNPFDVLVEETDPRYVHFELDLFWVTRGARDPVDVLRRIERRVPQYHVKDMGLDGSFTDPGQGLIDFPRIFRAHRVDEYIVERDDAGSPPRAPEDALETARVGYEYLANVRF